MSRQVGSLHRYIFHPVNLQNPLPIVPFFAFPPPESPHVNTSSCMESDTNSDITIFITNFHFKKSDIETPDELANSEPSPPFELFTPRPQMIPPHQFLIFPKLFRHTPFYQ